MTESQPSAAALDTDSIDVPGGGRVVIYPISYKLAKQFRKQAGEFVAAVAQGPEAIGQFMLSDIVSDLLDQCCVPNLSTVENLPLAKAMEAYSKWMALNFSGDKMDFTVALLEQTIEKLAGRKVLLKTIWSNFASLAGILAPISTDAAGPDGPTVDGASPSSISDLPLPPGSLVVNAQR